MGLIVGVFKNPLGDTTNGGISGRVEGLTIVNVAGPFEPSDKYPAAFLDTNGVGNPIIVPEAATRGLGVGPMMGGNYAASSDSRFRRAVEELNGGQFYGAVPIHDRRESQANLALMD